MSMLTAQCDELRETAADLREHSTFVGFGGIFSINDEMVDAARQMEDAADTIMGLRDRLTDVVLCHNVAPDYLDFLCSECGFVHYHSDANDNGEGNDWRYCPECGKKVDDET